jgi:aspartyl-tRNA(Asn)/glutamyl-tRNA(Gln) amidotransferase subunit C
MTGPTKVQVDKKLVQEIAALARLGLTEEETGMFISQFRDILDYVSILNEVDTGTVPPAYEVSTSELPLRQDRIEESTPTRDFLANAPKTRDGYVVIPRVHIEQ